MKRLLVALAVLCGVVLLMNFFSNRPSVPESPSTSGVSMTNNGDPFGVQAVNGNIPDDTTIVLTERESRLITQAEQDLAWLATQSPKAKELLEFFRAHRVRSKLRADGAIVTAEGSASAQWFAIAVGEKIGDLKPNEVVAAATFMTGARVMVINEVPFSRLVRAMTLAHELSHAQDAILHGEPDTEPLSEPWLFGEFRAHSVAHQILNEVSKNQWDLGVVKVCDDSLTAYKRSQGRRPDAFAFGQLVGDSARIVKAIGPVNRHDLGFLIPQLQIDTNMRMITRVSGQNEEMFNGLAHNLMEVFYQNHMPGRPTRT